MKTILFYSWSILGVLYDYATFVHDYVLFLVQITITWLTKLKLHDYIRANMQTCASALNSIVPCSSLGLLELFEGLCFGALSKVC
jgi:hypothetical protein